MAKVGERSAELGNISCVDYQPNMKLVPSFAELYKVPSLTPFEIPTKVLDFFRDAPKSWRSLPKEPPKIKMKSLLKLLEEDVPWIIRSEVNKRFTAKATKCYLFKYGVPRMLRTLYHPQAIDGEAAIILEKLFSRSRKGWDARLDYVPLKCRRARRIPVRIKPYKLVRGRSYHLPVNLGTSFVELIDEFDEKSKMFKVH